MHWTGFSPFCSKTRTPSLLGRLGDQGSCGEPWPFPREYVLNSSQRSSSLELGVEPSVRFCLHLCNGENNRNGKSPHVLSSTRRRRLCGVAVPVFGVQSTFCAWLLVRCRNRTFRQRSKLGLGLEGGGDLNGKIKGLQPFVRSVEDEVASSLLY